MLVAAYTQTFNKMGFIETEERDEIYMALRGILDALPGDALQKDADLRSLIMCEIFERGIT